ncbi:carbohydrate ABC transporter, N-acetylglucosamine/diacetylchitobiose-binding protein [Chloroflexia bacterium SDU3-3]|nr:carbohydrate ABC transporter, N-acetylglucosamine/diacetylchitobiose-binding protein [Chloroflexia bacterium SDU3-3]
MARNDLLSRRKFLKLAMLSGGTAAAGSLLAACGTSTPAASTAAPAQATAAPVASAAAAEATAAPVASAAATAEAAAGGLPFTVAADALDPFKLATDVEVDGVFFAGGFGDGYLKNTGTWMEQIHPGLKVKVQGIQQVGPQLQPRFVAGNPPDVVGNSGANNLDTVGLLNEGQLLDLSALMDAPSLDTPGKTFKETLIPGSQDDGVYEGKQMYLNMAYTVFGLWYSKTAFEKAGYTYPKTWAEMLTLCEDIKKGGVAPWTYQGKYPYYLREWVLPTLIYKNGGNAPLIKIDNLEASAWSDPSVVQAVEDLYALWDKGYILEGTAGMTHTEAQTAWLQGKAFFIPSGNWLENEMKTTTPADFTMVIGAIPGYADGKGDQNGVQAVGGEPFFVPSKGAHPQHGLEFLRVMLSKNSAKWFAENVSSVMPVLNGTEGANISAGMQSSLDLASTANGAIVRLNYGTWYRRLYDEGDVYLGELMTGVKKPADFIQAMQSLADEIAKDPDTKKYTRSA